jgi:putative phosphoesterase
MKLLIISDIHGNLAALEAVLAAEPQRDAVAFCGDVVDYGPQPVECLRWLKENVDHAVRGNHDNAVAFDVDCQCMGTFRAYSVATRAWHRNLLDETDYEFLRNLPTLDEFEWEGKRFRMAHATPQGDLFEYLSMDQWGDRLAGLDADFVLLGHTHVQGMWTFGKITVVNPGSVGLARDGHGEACYAVFQDGQAKLKRIRYDVDRTEKALRSAPLTAPVIEGLAEVLSGSR